MTNKDIERLIKDLIELGEKRSGLGAQLNIDDVLDQLEVTLYEIGQVDYYTHDTPFAYFDDPNKPCKKTAWNAIRGELEGLGKRV